MINAILIQARMGSTRLPGKVLMRLGDSEVLGQVIRRARLANVGEVIVVTTHNREDIPIVEYCSSIGVKVFCGSEQDVLDRYWQTAKLLDVDNIIRVTADCPLLDPGVLKMIAAVHCSEGADYTSNTIEETYPDGLDVEIFRKSVLQRAWKEATLSSEREHVTPYIKKNPQLFSLKSIRSEVDLSHMRWTIDQTEDYQFLQAVYGAFIGRDDFQMKDIIALLSEKPELVAMNGAIVRNEGYLKSLQKDNR